MAEQLKLPPGWTWTCTYAGDESMPTFGKLKSADGGTVLDYIEPDAAAERAWKAFGISRETYEAMERDHQAMEALRRQDAILDLETFKNGDVTVVRFHPDLCDPADAILDALGEGVSDGE